MDAFFASVEQRERPELRGKPVVVGAGSARGVVAAASYEARKYGIYSAMPGFRAKQLCPHAVFVPGRMELYAAISRQIREVFYEFTSQIEPIALDEAFLDISGSVHLWAGVLELAQSLKSRVLEETQLHVSVGVGPNKLVAKLACTSGKPDGLVVMDEARVREWMAPMPVRKLWGIGPVLAETLREHGIERIGQLAAHSVETLSTFAGRRAAEFQARARGIDPSPVCSDREAKSVGEENTFEHDVSDFLSIQQALTTHSETVAQRLRAARLQARTITLKVKLSRASGRKQGRRPEESEPIYPLYSRSLTLEQPSNDGATLRRCAVELWERLGLTQPVRLVGVSASNLVAASAPRQLSLFDTPKRDEVGSTMDAIVAKFGEGAIRRAVDAPKKITPNLHRRPGK
jgi:DNA polymerase IV